jgi:large subunit ribosomal protein L22
MEARAVAKNVRISADKARLVINLIRHKSVSEAINILNNINKKAARIIKKVLASAVANAENNLGLDKTKLYINKCYVNEGRVLKRIKPDSRSHVKRRDRRYSHITIIVSDNQ